MSVSRNMKAVLFKNTRKFVIEQGSLVNPDNIVLAMSLNKNLEKYGYTLDSSALRALATQTPAEMQNTWNDLVNVLEDVTGARQFRNAELFYPNFPEEVMKKDDAELYLNSLFYYTFAQSNDKMMDAIAEELRRQLVDPAKERLPLIEQFPRDLQIINKGTESDLFKMMNARIHSLNMSDEQFEELKQFSREYPDKFDQFIGSDEKFQSKETKVKIALMLHDQHRDTEIGYMLKDAVDVLRYAAMLSKRNGVSYNNVELKPADGGKISFKLSNSEQRQIKQLLNNCKSLYTDIWRQEELFKRLMQRINPTHGHCPDRVVKAFDNLAHHKKLDENGERIFNFENKINEAIKTLNRTHDGSALRKVAELRPGDYLKHYISICNKVNPDDKHVAIDAIRYCVNSNSVALKDLLTLNGMIEKTEKDLQAVDRGEQVLKIYSHHGGNKNYVKVMSQDEADNIYFEKEDFERMKEAVKATAADMVKGYQKLGNVYIDPELKNNKAPGREVRDASGGSVLTKYSTIPSQADKNLLMFGINWGQPDGSHDTWIDVDLSVHFYGPDYENKGYVSYSSLKHNAAVHSGDYTHVPSGGTSTEAVCMDKKRLVEMGIAYAVPEVHCYSINSFKKAGNCHFVMQQREGSFDDVNYFYNGHQYGRENQQILRRTDGRSDDGKILFMGKVFEPKASECNIKLNADCQLTSPCFYDVKEGKFYWLDFDITQARGEWHPSVTEDPTNMSKIMVEMARAKDNVVPDMASLFEAYATHNGTIVDSPDKADTVFVHKTIDREKENISKDARVITAFDLDVISDEFSGNKEIGEIEEKPTQTLTQEEPALVKQLRYLREKMDQFPTILRDKPDIDFSDDRDFNM